MTTTRLVRHRPDHHPDGQLGRPDVVASSSRRRDRQRISFIIFADRVADPERILYLETLNWVQAIVFVMPSSRA
jgi:hypothetical protein